MNFSLGNYAKFHTNVVNTGSGLPVPELSPRLRGRRSTRMPPLRLRKGYPRPGANLRPVYC